MRDWKYRWAIGYTFLASVLLVFLTFAVAKYPYLPGDIPITQALQAMRSPWLDQVMILVGLPGDPPQTLVLNALVVLTVFLCRMKPEALTLFLFIPTFGTVSTWIRCGIDRPRPTADLVLLLGPLKDRGCSFPSGHTANFHHLSLRTNCRGRV